MCQTPGSTHDKTKVGYEIPFTRHFYVFQPPRSLQEIDRDLKTVTYEILELLREVTHEPALFMNTGRRKRRPYDRLSS